MKKIYFACSIRGGRDDKELYKDIVEHLKPRCMLLTEIFADQKLTSQGMNKPSADIWNTDINWVGESDALIAEVSNPSLGVGYEIAKAEEWNKKILCLYRKQDGKKLSAMIDGSPNLRLVNYDKLPEVLDAIDLFLLEI